MISEILLTSLMSSVLEYNLPVCGLKLKNFILVFPCAPPVSKYEFMAIQITSGDR